MRRWPNAVDLALWPYVLHYAVNLYNMVLVLSDGTSRLEKFFGTSIGMHMQDHHTFACPAFALQNAISAGNTIPRWSPHAQLGLNLGPSPFHAQSIYLLLNLATCLVSLQDHSHFDDFFKTTHHNQPDIVISATWKQLSGSCQADGTPTTLRAFAEFSRAMQSFGRAF